MATMYCTLFSLSVGEQALLAGTLVCAVALIGGVAYFVPDRTLRRFTQLGVSLSVGVLLGDAFLHLIPDALVRLGNAQLVMGGTLGGLLLFFVLEKVVRWQHHHAVYQPGQPVVQAFAPMNLMGDAVHNFIDGTLIAGAFLVSPEAGWATTLGIVVHELPQEIGDIGALIAGGYPVRRAVLYNLLCATTCLLGVGVILAAGVWLEAYTDYALPLAAGGFIYIAASDLIPELHRIGGPATDQPFAPVWQSVFIAIGVSFMVGIIVFEHWLG